MEICSYEQVPWEDDPGDQSLQPRTIFPQNFLVLGSFFEDHFSSDSTPLYLNNFVLVYNSIG